MENLYRYGAPLGRVMLAALFLISGISKITAYEGTQQYMQSAGLPGSLLPLVIAFEIIASIMLIVGFKTRIVALLIAGYSVLSALLFHFDFGNQIQFLMFMKNISIAGGCLMIFALGAGPYSIDHNAVHTRVVR